MFIEGGALRAQRQARKISLRRLGGAMGVSAAYIHDLEFNRRPCNLPLAKRYLTALDKIEA